MKNRSRVEILYDIIDAARTSAKKTHLMYRSNLSFKQLDMYLRFLLGRGLVGEHLDIEDASKSYRVTPEGMQFISLFESLQELMGTRRSEVESLDAMGFMGRDETKGMLISRPLT